MLKRLLKCVKGYRKETILTPLFMLGEVVFELLIPYIMSSKILNYLAGLDGANPDFAYLVTWGLVCLLFACISFTCGTFSGVNAAKASAGFASNLRKDLFYNVQNFSFASVDKFSTSSLVTRLTTDVTNVQNSFMMIIRIAVRSPLMLIVSLILSLDLYPEVGVIYAIFIPVIAGSLIGIMAYVMPLFKRIFKKYDALNESVQENVKGMRVVKAYVREEYEKQKFEASAEDVKSNFVKAEKVLAFNNPIMMGCMYGTMLAIIIICGKAGIFGGDKLIVGKLQTLISYGMSVLMSFMSLSFIFAMSTIALASAKRIYEVLEEDSDIVSPENAITEVKDGSVEFKNVNFKYSESAENYALSNVNLKINSGETVGIIGGTGSSKTTLINLISRLYDVTDGEVLVAGVNVKDYDLKVLRDSVSVVLQKNLLFSGTISENIRWGDKDATDEEVKRVCKLACADEFVSNFEKGYDKYIEQGGTNVSGGQKQRLCIARALLKKPKVLILDDSTSAVDTKTDALIRKAFKEEIPNTTKIIIAQRVASVMDADKIVVMDGGKIVGLGTHAELYATNEIYREVYDTQNKSADDEEKFNKEGK
ncbi:MAG: ABC transporter ATP-binding protein [Clostridia bacterium]|nr:ABC transporter ATP-binding protein [Clostridia bacterium]